MNEDEIDEFYGIKRMAAGRAYVMMTLISLAMWGVIFGVAWALI